MVVTNADELDRQPNGNCLKKKKSLFRAVGGGKISGLLFIL